MKLYLVRHWVTIRKNTSKIKGQEDVPLSDIWQKQAESLNVFFQEKEVDIVWSSDLIRCIDTIQPFVQESWVSFSISSDIREKYFWDFQWISSEWREEKDWQKVHSHDSVESRQCIFERVVGFYEKSILTIDGNQNVVIVWHWSSLMILFALIFGKGDSYVDWSFQMFVWNASVSCFELIKWFWVENFIDKSV